MSEHKYPNGRFYLVNGQRLTEAEYEALKAESAPAKGRKKAAPQPSPELDPEPRSAEASSVPTESPDTGAETSPE